MFTHRRQPAVRLPPSPHGALANPPRRDHLPAHAAALDLRASVFDDGLSGPALTCTQAGNLFRVWPGTSRIAKRPKENPAGGLVQ